jgi:hypothetical protein
LAINTERNDDAIELVEHIRLTRYNIWRREQRQANTATRQADLLSYLEHLIQEDYKRQVIKQCTNNLLTVCLVNVKYLTVLREEILDQVFMS